jgi:hypothetical protein
VAIGDDFQCGVSRKKGQKDASKPTEKVLLWETFQREWRRLPEGWVSDMIDWYAWREMMEYNMVCKKGNESGGQGRMSYVFFLGYDYLGKLEEGDPGRW